MDRGKYPPPGWTGVNISPFWMDRIPPDYLVGIQLSCLKDVRWMELNQNKRVRQGPPGLKD